MKIGQVAKFDAALLPADESLPPEAEWQGHPALVEIVELHDDKGPVITYRRDDHATDDLGRDLPREGRDGPE